MSEVVVAALLLVLLLASVCEAQFNCSALVCNPCNEKRVPVDFIFIVDASPSMQDEIDTVAAGLQTFATEVASQDVDGAPACQKTETAKKSR
jgi:hypothetical protein